MIDSGYTFAINSEINSIGDFSKVPIKVLSPNEIQVFQYSLNSEDNIQNQHRLVFLSNDPNLKGTILNYVQVNENASRPVLLSERQEYQVFRESEDDWNNDLSSRCIFEVGSELIVEVDPPTNVLDRAYPECVEERVNNRSICVRERDITKVPIRSAEWDLNQISVRLIFSAFRRPRLGSEEECFRPSFDIRYILTYQRIVSEEVSDLRVELSADQLTRIENAIKSHPPILNKIFEVPKSSKELIDFFNELEN